MKIKYLLLSLLTPLLVSFCSATTNFDNLQDYLVDSGYFLKDSSKSRYRAYKSFTANTNHLVCVWADKQYSWGFYSFWTSVETWTYTTTSPNLLVPTNQYFPFDTELYSLTCSWWNKNWIWIRIDASTNGANYKIYDFSSFLSATITNNWGWGSDCSSVENQLSSCQSSLDTMSWSLASCQSSLSDCQWNWSHCDTLYGQCVENLSWCNADKVSLQNYNDSLSSQLNSCLASLTSWENASWLYLTYNMFWQDSDSMFSLPITNNLFLPNWYKWKLDDDNVLSIAKLNNLEAAYMFSDDDKVNIIDLLSMVMLFLLATWSLIWLIVFLKRLVIKK